MKKLLLSLALLPTLLGAAHAEVYSFTANKDTHTIAANPCAKVEGADKLFDAQVKQAAAWKGEGEWNNSKTIWAEVDTGVKGNEAVILSDNQDACYAIFGQAMAAKNYTLAK